MPATKVQLINGNFQDAEGNVIANGKMTLELSNDAQVSGVGQIGAGIIDTVPLDSNGNALGTPSPFTLTQVSVSGNVVTYLGTITGGANNAYAGVSMLIAGFTNGSNNGTFVVVTSSTTQFTVALVSQANETHAGTATGGTQFVWGTDVMTPTNIFYTVKVFTATGELAWGPNTQQITGATPFNLNTWVPNLLANWNPPLQPLLLETNGTKNGSQALLNLRNGSNVTITDDGVGDISIAAAGTTLQTNGTPNGSQSKLNLVNGANITITDDGVGDITIASSAPVLISPLKRIQLVEFIETSGTPTVMGSIGASLPTFGGAATASNQATAGGDPPTLEKGIANGGAQFSYAISNGGTTKMPIQKSLHGIAWHRVFDATTANSNNHLRLFPLSLYDTTGANGSNFFSATGTNPLVTGNHIGFYGLPNGGTANWQAYCIAAGVITNVDTGILIDATAHTFEVIVNSGATSVQFKIDGVVVVNSIATHIPASGTLLALYFGGIQEIAAAGAAAAYNILSSWGYMDGTF